MPMFRLLQGQYSEPDGTGQKNHDGTLKCVTHRVAFAKGPDGQMDPTRPVFPVFRSAIDLDTKFNSPGFPPKFERLGDDGMPASAGGSDPLAQMPGEPDSVYRTRIQAFLDRAQGKLAGIGAQAQSAPPAQPQPTSVTTLPPKNEGGAQYPPLESMTVKQIREWAEAQEIDVGTEQNKDKLIRIIKGK